MNADSDENGHIEIVGDQLSFTGEWGDWKLPIESIRVIGESHTGNAEDPWSHMIHFIASANIAEGAPVLAQGLREVLRQWEVDWNTDLSWRLGAAGEFRSTVMHPKSLRGQPFMTLLEPEKDPRDAEIPGMPLFGVSEPTYTEEVRAYLRLF